MWLSTTDWAEGPEKDMDGVQGKDYTAAPAEMPGSVGRLPTVMSTADKVDITLE